MSRQWEPGDVAVIKFARGDVRSMYTNRGWVLSDMGHVGAMRGFDVSRSLVVIDPLDREQMSAIFSYELRCHIEAILHTSVDDYAWQRMAARVEDAIALRSLITPPRLEEPTGLGAVVEDAKGRIWTRIWGNTESPWRCAGHSSRTWEHLDAVKVLSEGVTP